MQRVSGNLRIGENQNLPDRKSFGWGGRRGGPHPPHLETTARHDRHAIAQRPPVGRAWVDTTTPPRNVTGGADTIRRWNNRTDKYPASLCRETP